MFWFFWTLTVLLRCWCSTCHLVVQAWSLVYTPRENWERPESGKYFKIFEKNTIFNEHPVIEWVNRWLGDFAAATTSSYSISYVNKKKGANSSRTILKWGDDWNWTCYLHDCSWWSALLVDAGHLSYSQLISGEFMNL